MATVFIDEARLTAIGDAIRAKTGGTELIPVVEMPTEIAAIVSGGGTPEGIPESAFTFTNSASSLNVKGTWDWFFETYGNQITTTQLRYADYAFQGSKLISIPFDFNFDSSYDNVNVSRMFKDTYFLESIGKIVNLHAGATDNMFQYASNLRELPEFVNPDFSYVQNNGYINMSHMFEACNSLRSVPESLLKKLYNKSTSSTYAFYNYAFNNCFALDELRGFPVTGANLSTNLMLNTFNYCHRLKDLIFDTDNGTPKVANWKNQVIDLSNSVGYGPSINICGNNSGITQDKGAGNSSNYQKLKNDPDWFAEVPSVSRYNHDSAVNTINSLPDCSSYGTNTIKFRGAAGSETDGGAINTLTEEEIAVATAKGWTVSFV